MVVDFEVRDKDGRVLTETLPLWRKRRYHLVVLVFLGFINIYTLRINLSVGIVGKEVFIKSSMSSLKLSAVSKFQL
jgi:hypothetical protein